MTALSRTPEEIHTKLCHLISYDSTDDFFGVMAERLVMALPYEKAAEYLKDGVTRDCFDQAATHTVEAIRDEAKNYLSFAVQKMKDERGLSANRSIDHYRALIWLAFDDTTVEDFENTDYGWYGDTQLSKAAELFGLLDVFTSLLDGNQ